MAATSPAMSAVPPSRAGTSALAGVLAIGAAAIAFVGGLGAAYLSFRSGNPEWVDKAMSFDNYTAVMTTFSMLLASFAVIWASVSARIGQRRWAATGFAMAVVIGLASLNMVWSIGRGIALAGDGEYAVAVYTLLVVGGLAIAAGIASSLAGFSTAFGGHSGPSSPVVSRAFAWGQHIAGLVWIAVFLIIYLKK